MYPCSEFQQVHSETVEHVDLELLVPAELSLPGLAQAALPRVELDAPAFLECEADAAQKALFVELSDVAVACREHDRRIRWDLIRAGERLVQLQLEKLVHTLFAVSFSRR
jgi:hypothetical protein